MTYFNDIVHGDDDLRLNLRGLGHRMRLGRRWPLPTWLWGLLLLETLLGSTPVWAQGETITQRFALLSAAEQGGGTLPDLLYPRSDADKLARALVEMGGVNSVDLRQVEALDAETLRQAFIALQQDMRAARQRGQRVEFLFYYSGHADEEGLRLGQDHLRYRELRALLNDTPADLRLAILDACASGELTRQKGGQTRAPFLQDSSRSIKGLAIMTSSSAEEASQESDRLGGSFFTHYLVNALRGAADDNGDGLVTMAEAYQYTYDETLQRTQKTQSGPQHPAFAMHLAGSGEVVLSDLRSVAAALVLSEALDGDLYILDAQGRVSAQVNKTPGQAMELGLEPGDYDLALHRGAQLWLGHLNLLRRERQVVSLQDFKLSSREWTQARGATTSLSGLQYESAFWEFALWPGFGSNGELGSFRTNHASLTLFGGDGARLEGVGLSLFRNKTRQDLYGFQLALLGINQVGHEVRGAQLGLLGNWVNGDLLGLQLALAGNYCAGQMYGLQISPVLNLSRGPVTGLQISNLVSFASAGVRGAQLASALNVTTRLQGLQMGMVNVASQVQGLQIGTLANFTSKSLWGAQLGAPFNSAKKLQGLQFGLVNSANQAQGVQIGLVNLAGDIKGLQLGLINLSDNMQGVPLGPFSFAGNSPVQAELWVEDSQLFNLAIELGSRYGFNLFSVGVFRGQHSRGTAVERSSRTGWTLGMGWGLRAPLDSNNLFSLVFHNRYLWLDDWSVDSVELLSSLRAAWIYRVQPRLALQLGLSLNLAITQDIDNASLSPLPQWRLLQDPIQIGLWPGLFAGLVF